MFAFERLSWVGCLLAGMLALSGTAPAQQPASPLTESWPRYQQLRQTTPFGLQWIQVGPVVNSARVEAVQLVPTRPGWMYVAFGSGGLWKTTNHGLDWKPIFENQATYGIGDIAVAPSDPDVIYVGTGESLKKARNFTIPGTGVYRSVDGGDNWQHLGLDDSWQISEIAVHPTNPEIAIVAVLGHFWTNNRHRGLYRTGDGGQSWQQVLYVDDQTGANDIVWAASDPSVVYASMWQHAPEVAGAGSGIYRSRDAGATWEKCAQGLPAGDDIGRIGLAVSWRDPNKVYALIDHRGRIDSGAAQVYRSLDGGTNWDRTHQDELAIFSRIGWYFADLYVNPQDDEEIFALGVRIAHSRDGGGSFNLIGGDVTHLTPSAASGLHLDHCELWINPGNSDHLVLGNDGGLYESLDRGKSWLHFNNLPTGEFYDLAVGPGTPPMVYAGAQDNATVRGLATEWGPSRREPWEYVWIDPWNGGDGCVSAVDPADPNTVYFSAQEGAFRRQNVATRTSVSIRPRLPKGHEGQLKFNFVAPLEVSPHDSRTLYTAGNYVLKSTNRGDDWEPISPDLSTDPAGVESVGGGTIAESPRVRGLLYLGTDQGACWVRETNAERWVCRSESLPRGYIRSIYPSRYVDSRVYLAVTGLNRDDLQTYLYCSEDRGQHWTSLASNLSDEPANVIVEDPWFADVLYAGTFRGVYVSRDRGASWSLLGSNLPACSVADIEIHLPQRDLIVATHGRGIFRVNLQPLHDLQAHPEWEDAPIQLLVPPAAVQPGLSDVRPGLNFQPGPQTPLTFWLGTPGMVQWSVLDADGSPLFQSSLNGSRGLNQIRWDRVVATRTNPLPYFINYRRYLDPGHYRLQVRDAQGRISEQTLTVVDSEAKRPRN